MVLAQADQILDRGMIRPPSACAWLKKPGPDRVNYITKYIIITLYYIIILYKSI